jgi:hypothetical protein
MVMTFLTKRQFAVGGDSLSETADPCGAAPAWFLLPLHAGGRPDWRRVRVAWCSDETALRSGAR